MTFTRDDFRRIRWALLGFLLMAAAGIAAAVVAERWYEREQRQGREAQQRLQDIHGKLTRTRAEQAEINAKIERFNQLLARGVIGEERRLDWVERLQAIRAERRLYDVQYELSPQGPLDPSLAPGSSGSYEFLMSSMRLSMPLLHEEDLLHLLGDVGGSVSAYVRPRSCSVSRADAQGGPAQLRAECMLDWITLREPKRAG